MVGHVNPKRKLIYVYNEKINTYIKNEDKHVSRKIIQIK